MQVIFTTLDNYERFHRHDANMSALVHARGWSSLMSSSFISGEGTRIPPIDLLPYPGDIKTGEGEISGRTARILVKLIKEKLLPHHVVDAATDLEEVRKVVERDHLWQVAPN